MQCEIDQKTNIAICTRSSAPHVENPAATASSSVCLHLATSAPKLCNPLAKIYPTFWGSCTTEFLDLPG